MENTITIGFVGLGAMGLGMATNLLRQAKYSVSAYDVWAPSVDKFLATGGRTGLSPRAVAQNSAFLICMAANAKQIDSILFDSATGALQSLPQNATILICSTVPPSYYDTLPSRIAGIGRSDILVVDAPVSGGTLRAANGTLTIFLAAASPQAIERAGGVLRDMSEKLYVIAGGLGAGSKMKMVNQLLVGAQIATAAEAIGFATKAGLDTKEVFDIIQHTAGNSWAWSNRVPHMLQEDWTPLSALNIFVKDMGIVVSAGRSSQFALPIASAAEQLYISGSAHGYGLEDDAGLVRLFLHGASQGTSFTKSAGALISTHSLEASVAASAGTKLAVIGLDSLIYDIPLALVQAGFTIKAFDHDQTALKRFTSNIKKVSVANSPADAARGANFLFLSVSGAEEVDDVLFGPAGAAEALVENAIILLSSAVTSAYVLDVEKRLERLGRNLTLLDIPLCHGGAPLNNPCVTMIYSGSDSTIDQAKIILESISPGVGRIRRVQGPLGSASTLKLIDQAMAGVHIIAAAEALSFSAHLGLDTEQVFELLQNAAAWSWMFQTRVPKMLRADWASLPALGDMCDDLGAFLDEAKRLMFWAPMTSAAHNLYVSGVMRGWASQSDACVLRLYETTSKR